MYLSHKWDHNCQSEPNKIFLSLKRDHNWTKQNILFGSIVVPFVGHKYFVWFTCDPVCGKFLPPRCLLRAKGKFPEFKLFNCSLRFDHQGKWGKRESGVTQFFLSDGPVRPNCSAERPTKIFGYPTCDLPHFPWMPIKGHSIEGSLSGTDDLGYSLKLHPQRAATKSRNRLAGPKQGNKWEPL